MPSFLIADDDPDVRAAAAMVAGRLGDVDAAASPAEVVDRVAGKAYDAVLLDMNFTVGERGGREGFDCLAALKAADPALSVVLMTAFGGVALAVDSLKRGAVDFVLKPWRNEVLTTSLEQAARHTEAARNAQPPLNLDDLEKAAIVKALALFDGNISQTAAALGVTRPALYRRMERHGL